MNRLPLRILSILLLAPLLVPSGIGASRSPVRGKRGMVVSTEARATEVGVTILQKGGNAVDAAVAVGFALSVTHPAAGNLGGGGFMLLRNAKTADTVAIDYRETAPKAASRTMYLDKDGDVVPEASTVGYRAIAVPGTVAGLELALQKYGTMSLSEVMAPAIALARDGVELSYYESESLRQNCKILERIDESRHLYIRDGNYYAPGERFIQRDLARSLEAIAREGSKEFYQDSIAELIVKDIQANGGLVTREDLRDYRPVVRKAIEGRYRGYQIFSTPPPSSGGIILIEMLNILEDYPLANYGQGSSRTLHLLAETMKRAFADRAEFLGDEDFVRVPKIGLTSKLYAKVRRATIDPFLAFDSLKLGHGDPSAYESEQTTHFSVVDADGNVVANTYTLNGAYGSGVTIPGTGILMNNEMDDFSAKPGSPNAYGLIHGEANAIAPRKRPLSAMTPTIVVRDGKPFMVLGSPGGPTIINTILQTLINVIDFKMTVQEAVDAPRIHHQWMPDKLLLEKVGFVQDVVDALKARGHTIDYRTSIGNCHAILVDPATGTYLGAADPRADGRALGY